MPWVPDHLHLGHRVQHPLPTVSAEAELPMNLEGLQRDSPSPLLSSP